MFKIESLMKELNLSQDIIEQTLSKVNAISPEDDLELTYYITLSDNGDGDGDGDGFFFSDGDGDGDGG
jgi:hypothetical protein